MDLTRVIWLKKSCTVRWLLEKKENCEIPLVQVRRHACKQVGNQTLLYDVYIIKSESRCSNHTSVRGWQRLILCRALGFFACCRQTERSHAAGMLTWCYQSRWCETASPAPPRSACHQRRRPGTHPETVFHHLQRHTNTSAFNYREKKAACG